MGYNNIFLQCLVNVNHNHFFPCFTNLNKMDQLGTKFSSYSFISESKSQFESLSFFSALFNHIFITLKFRTNLFRLTFDYKR